MHASLAPRLAVTLTLSLALSLFAACKGDQTATGDAAKQAMGLYAKGFNVLLKDPEGLITSYFEAIPEAGPAADARPHLFNGVNFAAGAIKDARASFTAAGAAAPPPLAALAPASEHAITAAEHVLAVYGDAVKYYDAETYKDDRFAKARQLHAAMLAARTELATAMAALEDGLSGIEDAQALADIKDRESAKDYGYWFRAYTYAAKRFLAASRDAGAVDAALSALSSSHAGLTAFVTAKGAALATGFGSYVTAADGFLAAATVVSRAAKASKPDELHDARQGLIAAYNNVITAGNFLYQLESTHSLK